MRQPTRKTVSLRPVQGFAPVHRVQHGLLPALILFFSALATTKNAYSNDEVIISENTTVLEVIDEDGSNPRQITVHHVLMENEFLRVTVYPELGGRVASVFDKSRNREMFLRRPVSWPKTRYTAYGSQLGGIEVNFPCFHHGNSFFDKWNWLARNESDGSATILVAWTEPDSRNRVVHRLSLAPHESIVRSSLRFANLNALPGGFAPWSNMFFGYSKGLQFIIPSPWVAPHGFNDSHLNLLPWPWPDWDETSICFWRNIPREYQSIFAIAAQENFHGVYDHSEDAGMVRVFDRTITPGIKMYCVPPTIQPNPNPTDYCEIWTGPALVHEDARWWEAYGTREYSESYFPVHGIGGYRFACDAGAVNLIRHSNTVELGVYVTRDYPSAVIKVAGIDGAWLHTTADLHPARPFRTVIPRSPDREPLEVIVSDSSGAVLIRWSEHPDPGMRVSLAFSGKPLWSATAMRSALKAEQYHPLWRGPTGGYGDYCAKGIEAYRSMLSADPDNIEAALGLARCLIFDAQLRKAYKPLAGSPTEAQTVARQRIEQASEILRVLASKDPRAAGLYAEVLLRRGLHQEAASAAKRATNEPVARVCAAVAAGRIGDIKTARQEAQIAARLFPDSPPVIQLAAGLEIIADNSGGALQLLNRLYHNDPLDPLTLFLQEKALRRSDPNAADIKEQELRRILEQCDPPFDIQAELQRLGLHALTLENNPR